MSTPSSIVTFGEIMLRLTPTEKFDRLVKTNSLKMGYAGAESNVAISLAQWNHEVYYVTRLPENPLGEGALHLLKSFGVHTHHVLRGGHRIGIYFIEGGASIRSSKVIYDRTDSAIQNLSPDEIPWNTILKDKDWLHLTGITPALSPACTQATIEAAKAARKLGVKVSFDPNFRRKLWSDSSIARKIFDKILENTDLLIANEGVLRDVYELNSSLSTAQARCEELMTLMQSQYKFKAIAFTQREQISASHNLWSGLLYDGGQFYSSGSYDLQLVDRFGAGDAFAAGLLHGYQSKWNPGLTIQFASAASALKQTIPGDLNIISEAEVLSVVDGHISGHTER